MLNITRTVSEKVLLLCCCENENEIEFNEKAVYLYGLELILNNVIKMGFYMLISIVLGKTIESLIIFASFAAIRIFACGWHARTDFGCFAACGCMWGISLLCSEYCRVFQNTETIVIVIILNSLLVLFSPSDNDCDTMKILEVLKLKMSSILVLNLLLGISFFQNTHWKNCILVPVLIECITIIPIGGKRKWKEKR